MWSTEENPKKETGKEKPESGKREASCQGNQRDRASQSREVGIANKAEEWEKPGASVGLLSNACWWPCENGFPVEGGGGGGDGRLEQAKGFLKGQETEPTIAEMQGNKDMSQAEKGW